MFVRCVSELSVWCEVCVFMSLCGVRCVSELSVWCEVCVFMSLCGVRCVSELSVWCEVCVFMSLCGVRCVLGAGEEGGGKRCVSLWECVGGRRCGGKGDVCVCVLVGGGGGGVGGRVCGVWFVFL